VSNRKKGKSKNGGVLVAAVERSIENFVEHGAMIIRENPDAANELVKALDDVKKTGTQSWDRYEGETDTLVQEENKITGTIESILRVLNRMRHTVTAFTFDSSEFAALSAVLMN
jgi:hypothetical protein